MTNASNAMPSHSPRSPKFSFGGSLRWLPRAMFALVLIASGLPLWAESWQTELVSRGFPGDVGNAASTAPAPSSVDGRYVVFSSLSSNLVAGQVDTNNANDVFLFDRVTQTTSLVSGALGSATTTANNESYPGAISADGNWVLYSSRATNVVSGVTDGNSNWDVFLFDRSTGSSALVSRALGSATTTANNQSSPATISADGNWVLFHSYATNVVAGVTEGNGTNPDVFLFDRSTGNSTLVSRALGSATATANGSSYPTAISADGNWVLYASYATNVIAGVTDGNGTNPDVFLFDRSTGSSTLVSRALGSATATANNQSLPYRMSDDGNWVLYESRATNVVAGVTDGNGNRDVFLFDRSTGTSSLVSRALGSATSTANNESYPGAISADGSWVLYASYATNVVAGVTDGNGTNQDVFLFDRSTGNSTLVSRALGSATATPNNQSSPAAISADGNWVLYKSNATNVVAGVTDSNGTNQDVFLFDRGTGNSTLVSRALGTATATANGASGATSISADGNWVLYSGLATNVVVGVTDGNGTNPDVFLFNRSTGSSTLVSRAFGSATATANIGSGDAAISANGNWVLFSSAATNVVSGVTDNNGASDVVLFDRSTGTSSLVSRALGSATTTANGWSYPTAISADGNWVLYASQATNVVAGVTDSNGTTSDVFLFDRSTGTSTLVSRALGSATATANNGSYPTAISADGNWVLYYSNATNVVAGVTDGNGAIADSFLFDRSTGTSTLVSRALGSATATANNGSYPTAISADGNRVLYQSKATNVITGVTDGNGTDDVFLFDRSTGSSTLVSRALGSATATANGSSYPTAINADGNWVLYYSHATNVVAGVTDGNGTNQDVFLFDRSTGASSLVSRALGSATATANNAASPTGISADGSWVLYYSHATNVVAGVTDGNATTDVFLFDRSSSTTTLVSRAMGSATATANNQSFPTVISADGNWALYQSYATNVVAGVTDSNGTSSDVFLFDRATGISTLVSRALGSSSATANNGSYPSSISADGGAVLFLSDANNILSDVLDGNTAIDVFVSQHRFTITPTTGPGGSVSPATAVDVNAGATQAFTVTPDSGYSVQSVSGCGGTWTGSNPYTTAPITADCTVTSSFVINQYTLSYSAGANGSITGASPQMVNHGANGTAVTAVPDLGYHFVQWTDNSTANPRTDSNVTANISVTATFANEAPSIAAVGDQTVLEDSSTAQITFQVADLESAAASLVVTAASSETGLIPNPSVGAGASDGERVLTYAPMAHQNGSTVITLTINDPAGGSAQRSFIINVTAVNDAPQLSLGSVTAHPAATSGMQSVPGFATVVLGPAEEPTTQAIDDFVFQITDPDGVLSALDIGNDGALSYTLTGVGGTASISARVRDNGGTSNGGVDLSSTRNFSIEAARGADLQVAKTNARQHLLVGEQVVYAIVVANAGPNAANGATIDDPLPTTLSGGNWMCVQALSTATCPSPDAGGGNLNATIDLSVNQYLRFDVLATVNAAVNETVSNTATVAVPNGVAALNTGNDSSTDADPVVPEVVHRDGFESDPGSNLTVPGAEEALRL